MAGSTPIDTEVHGRTTAHPHCGLCSQCIDRRFAVIAAGLEAWDPLEAYEVDPLAGPRYEIRDREIGLGYVQNARRFAAMTPADFVRGFGEIQRALGYLGEPAGTTAELLFDLHKRHGAAVANVMNDAIRSLTSSPPGHAPLFHADSLVMLAGRDFFTPAREAISVSPASLPDRRGRIETVHHWTIELPKDESQALIKELGTVSGAGATVLRHLAVSFLEAAGTGCALEDYPLAHPIDLAAAWQISEAGVRRRISLLRWTIRQLATGAGREPPDDGAIVENLPGRGYRLNPETIRVVAAPRPKSNNV